MRNLNCELQNLADRLRLRKIRLGGERIEHLVDDKNPFIVRDYNKCIKCRRCEAVCREQGVSALAAQNRSLRTVIGPAFKRPCRSCLYCLRSVRHGLSHRRADGKRKH